MLSYSSKDKFVGYSMNYVIFLSGFLIGAILTFVLQQVLNKRSKDVENALYEKMKIEFENTALKVFNTSTDGIKDKNKECLEDFIKQFKEQIEDFEKRNAEIEKDSKEKLLIFNSKMEDFLKKGDQISQDAASLSKVMKADNRTSGRWGEIVLERVFECSGLKKGEEYNVQKVIADGKPDATVFLPDNKKVFVDAKTSFASWDSYLNAQNDEEKDVHLKEFKQSIRKHIDGLKKKYDDDNAFQYTMMFIPIESCYSLIFCDDCELWDYAWKNNVMPVSPSTLLAALKIVNSVMIIDRQNKNAHEIAKICRNFISKFSGLQDDLKKVKAGLDNALKRLDGKGNMLVQIGKLQDLCGKIDVDVKMVEVNSEEDEE